MDNATAAALARWRSGGESLGVSAGDLADALGLLRNNVSMELNALVREKKALKILGKPVLYLASAPMEDAFKQVFPESFAGRTALQNFLANQAVSDRKTTERSTAWREEIQQVIGFGLAREIAETWLQVEFEGGRHARRVEKITALEKRC